MYENNSKNICSRESKLEYTYLSLMSHKLHVGIIGSGEAGIIKARYFLKNACKVSMISKEFNKDSEIIKSLMKNNNFTIECREYEKDFILDKHVIIIAVNNYKTKIMIKEDCDNFFKIYVDCTKFRDGLAVIPVQRNSNNLVFGINTTGGNPKGSVFVADKLRENIKAYDAFIEYTTKLRNKFINFPHIKKEVLNFIFTEDFYFFYEKGKGEEILKLFYNEVQ